MSRGRIRLDAISKRYDDGPMVVRDITLDVAPGEFVSLLGPSGCGKSTILRMLAGFETVTEGRIRKDDTVLAGPDIHVAPEKRAMGMVFQSYALWPHMTVAGNVAYPLKVAGLRGADLERRTRDALDAVELTPFRDRSPKDLSGGQRQRVALGRCLVMEPDVILLDEPLANLDRHLKAAMEETFRAFHHRIGASMIYVTHDQAEAMALSDRIAVLDEGRLVQCDTPQAIYERPAEEAVARLIGNRSMLSASIPDGAGPALDAAAILVALGDTKSEPGPRRQLLVRPEHVHPVGDADAGLAVRVTDCVYRGERFVVTGTLADGQTLMTYADRRAAPGDTLRLRPERAWIVGASAEPER